jgi:hypothetical protein
VAWWTGYARGPNGEIDVCFRVVGPEYGEIAATVRRERGPIPPPPSRAAPLGLKAIPRGGAAQAQPLTASLDFGRRRDSWD